MRTGTRAVAVLALAIIGGAADAVRADFPLSAGRRPTRGGPLLRRQASRRPPEASARQQGLLDQLDDARINRDLLEMEVAADKAQIEKMMTVLRDTELTPIQGFSLGPVIGGSDQAERSGEPREVQERAGSRLYRVCDREQGPEPGAASRGGSSKPSSASLRRLQRPPTRPCAALRAGSLPDAERVLDLILRGVETWQRATPSAPDERSSPPPPPGPSPTPEDRPLKDAERFLDLLRRGIESWRSDPSAPPEERPVPEQRPDPGSVPEKSLLKDAERLLDLLRRGVESWQGR